MWWWASLHWSGGGNLIGVTPDCKIWENAASIVMDWFLKVNFLFIDMIAVCIFKKEWKNYRFVFLGIVFANNDKILPCLQNECVIFGEKWNYCKYLNEDFFKFELCYFPVYFIAKRTMGDNNIIAELGKMY